MWLIKQLLGKKLRRATIGALDLACEEYAGTVTDPEMHKNGEDFKFCVSLRRDLLTIEKAWGLPMFPQWEQETAWMETHEVHVA